MESLEIKLKKLFEDQSADDSAVIFVKLEICMVMRMQSS